MEARPTAGGEDFERRLHRLEAIEEVRRLKQRYALLCDAGYPADELAQLFTEDAVWDGGGVFGVHRGRDAIRAIFAGTPADVFSFHCMLGDRIDVSDDAMSATGTWRMLELATLPAEDGERHAMWLAAVYTDVCRREHDGWKFSSVTLDFRVRARHLEGWAQQRL